MGHQTLVEGEWFQILAAHQRETLVGVGMANAGEPLFGDFIEEEGGGGMGTNGGQLVGGSGARWKILLGVANIVGRWEMEEEQKKVRVG